MTADSPNYRHLLMDFRADVFRQVTLVMALFCIAAAYALVFTQPLPHQLVFCLYVFSLYTLRLRKLAKTHLNIARYAFVISLYVGLCAVMLVMPVSWLPFLVFPFVLLAELLVSHASLILSALFFAFAALLVRAGYADYPLAPLALFLCLMLTISNRGIDAINTLLLWYRSMYQHTNDLLEQARTHRAEVVQILKSLEISYDTQQRLQSQLVYARQQADEAKRMKERFASNISHELRTPLNIILGFTEIMHLTPEVYGDVIFPPRLQRDIYQVHRNSRHLLDMIDDVLDLSHIEISQFSLNFEPTDLNAFLRDTVEMVGHLFRNPEVAFVVDIADGLPQIEMDRTRIRQVLINLLNNAQRFTPSGSVTFSVRASETQVEFVVADTGIGIPQDRIHLIFEEFFQVDYSLSRAHGGAGLGLAITRRFVEAHNGQLQVESVEGKGSTFTFMLPRASRTPREAAAPRETPTEKPESLWLVVDADPLVGKLIERHTPGRALVQIEDERRAGDALRRYNPQGIILNQLPGADVPPELAQLPVPLVVCSLPSTTHMVRTLGVDGCLTKPVRLHQIIDLFGRYERLRTVLVVDDDIGVVQLVQRSIETQYTDMRIQRAYDGQQALEIMRNTPPDLVLLDLAMPGMSGFEVIETMKNEPRIACIPVILLTATKYIVSEEETRSDLRVHQAGGLPPMDVLKLLGAVMGAMELEPSPTLPVDSRVR